jgi:hypothetical protein
MYGEQALLKSGRFDSEYIVTLRFPLREKPASVTGAESQAPTSAAPSVVSPR